MEQAGAGLVYSSLQSLLRLQGQVRTLNLAKRHIRSRHVGLHRSVFKGRGMDFAESRPYLPGDDIRTIDWRVTARTGKVHTKTFQEEREKPVLLWVDQRPAMRFATRGRFKSVVAAEMAAVLVWKTLSEGDRAGGILQTQAQHQEFKPSRGRSTVLNFLRKLATSTREQPAADNVDLAARSGEALADSWRRLRRVAEHGTQVFVISDFRGADAAAFKQLAHISRHAHLTLIAIRDPMEEQLPDAGRLRLTDGRRSVWVNLKQRLWRRHYEQQVSNKQERLREFARKHRTALVRLSTADTEQQRLLKLARVMA